MLIKGHIFSMLYIFLFVSSPAYENHMRKCCHHFASGVNMAAKFQKSFSPKLYV
jgi:hypothetical protein